MPLIHPVKIGNIEFDSNIFLAPLSGCSDLAFRLIAREHGAGTCFFEMIDAHSVILGPERKMLAILKTNEDDNPIAAQILGSDPQITLRAANEIIAKTSVSFLDVNAACPARKVIKKGAGAYLLREPKRLHALINKLSASLAIPVTVKIRIGYDIDGIGALPAVAKGCEDSGASAIFVHGRTSLQGYAGDIDYGSIRKIKDSVKIPVFGTGNIFNAESAKTMFDETGCDGITIARGSLGNPWIFSHIKECLDSGKPAATVDFKYKKTVLKRHLSYIDKYKDCSSSGKSGFMRKVVLWYLKGFPEARRIREKVSLVNGYDKMIKLIDEL